MGHSQSRQNAGEGGNTCGSWALVMGESVPLSLGVGVRGILYHLSVLLRLDESRVDVVLH